MKHNSNNSTHIFSKVKKTLSKLSFTPNSSEDADSHNLSLMNTPAIMGRRDAAYDKAVELLKKNIFSFNEEMRKKIYGEAVMLLEVSIKNTKHITPNSNPENTDAILDYLIILNDTVKAAQSLVLHELILYKGEKNLSNFIGKKLQTQFRTADQIFSNSEVNIFHSINELITVSTPAITRYRQFKKRTFGKNNIDRYNKSFLEYTKLYEVNSVLKNEDTTPE